MYCKKCGAYMPDQSEFCPACGARNPRHAEVPVVTAPRRSNTLIIGIIIAVTVIVVVAMFCVTWLVSGNRSSEEDESQSLEAAQTEEIQTEEQDETESESASTDEADSTETTADSTAETTAAVESQTTTDTEQDAETAGDDAEEEDASYTVTNNYYYYGSNAVRDNQYYTKTTKSEYLWPTDTEYISMSDLSGLSQDTVAAIRNEIYARHGYAFQTSRWQNYFAAKSWYHRDSSCTEDTINARLTSIEKANINTIVAYEESMGWR